MCADIDVVNRTDKCNFGAVVHSVSMSLTTLLVQLTVSNGAAKACKHMTLAMLSALATEGREHSNPHGHCA